MKKNFLLLACVAMLGNLAMAATITAPLTDATVFLNGAQLHHYADLQLQKGDNEIIIDGLSPLLEKNSLQIALGKTGVVMSAYEFSLDYLLPDQPGSPIRLLKDSIARYKEELGRINNEQEAIKQMLELLQNGVKHTLTAENKAVSNESIDRQLNYYKKQHLQLSEQQLTLKKEKKAVKEKLDALNKQLEQDGQCKTAKGTIRLKLNSPTAQTIRTQIQYFTAGANWRVGYDMNITNPSQPLTLTTKAYVSQRTNIDWNNVRLTLSTGSPSDNNNIPELETWFLSEQPAYYKRALATAAPGMAYDDAEVVVEEIQFESNTMAQFISVNQQQLAREYAIDLPYTILGNGKEQIIALGVQDISDIDYRYYSVPKLDATAYFTGEINNWNALGLLSGMVNITYDGTFYGETYINPDNIGDSLLLTLGTDPEISIRREAIQDYTATKTIGSTTTKTMAYRITVRNNKKQAADMRLQEPYPVSGNKDITVELTNRTSTWTENNTEKGILTYDFTLQAGQTQEIIVEYRVKYPKNMLIRL